MDPVTIKMLSFMMILTRLSAFFLSAPILNSRSIPARIKMAIIILLSILFSMVIPPPADLGTSSAGPSELPFLVAIIKLFSEAAYGLCLGIILSTLFAAVRFAAGIIERRMGMAMASIMNPITGDQSQSLAVLLEMMFILAFLSADGHYLILSVISRSFDAFPLGTAPTTAVMTTGVADAGSVLLTAGLRISAPILAGFLLLTIILAVMARVAPEANILFISMPMRVGLGILTAGIFMPLILEFISEFSNYMGELLPL